MKFTTLVDPSFVNLNYDIRRLSDVCPGVEMNVFKEINQFYTFYPKILTPWNGAHKLYNFFFPFLADDTYQILYRFVQKFLRRRCRRTKYDAH